MKIEITPENAVSKYTAEIQALNWILPEKISSTEDAADVAQIMNEAGRILAEIEKARKTITRPIDEAKKNVMTIFNNLTHKPELVEAEAKTLLRDWQKECKKRDDEATAAANAEAERERQRLLKRADNVKTPEKALSLRRQAELITAPVIVSEKIDGVQFAENWTYRVIDEAMIPREYLIIDTKKINAIVKATKGSLIIPGLEIYADDVVKNMKGENQCSD